MFSVDSQTRQTVIIIDSIYLWNEKLRIIHLVIRGGMTSYTFSLSRAAWPLLVLCGSIPVKKKSTFNLLICWKGETDHRWLVTIKLSSQIRSLVSSNWAQIRDNGVHHCLKCIHCKVSVINQKKNDLTSYCPPEDSAGGSEVKWSTGRVGVHPLAEESQVLHCTKQNIQFTTNFQWFHIHKVSALKTQHTYRWSTNLHLLQ